MISIGMLSVLTFLASVSLVSGRAHLHVDVVEPTIGISHIPSWPTDQDRYHETQVDIDVRPSDILEELKNEVTGTLQGKQEFVFDGNSLGCVKKLSDYTDQQHAPGRLAVRQLYIDSPRGTDIVWFVPESTVGTLKESIAGQLGVPAEQQVLSRLGRVLGDEEQLCSYGVDEDNVLDFTVQPARDGKSYSIFVETESLDGRDPDVLEYIQVKASDTLGALRSKIEAKSGVRGDRFKFMFGNKPDDDDRTLASYHIQSGDELSLFFW